MIAGWAGCDALQNGWGLPAARDGFLFRLQLVAIDNEPGVLSHFVIQQPTGLV